MTSHESIEFQEIEGETEVMPPEIFAAHMIEWATERHASDLFISDAENSVTISIRRLGRVELVRRVAKAYGRRLQGHLRVATGSDPGEVHRPTEGRGLIRTPSGIGVDLRLSSLPSLFGQDISIRLFDPTHGSRQLEELGLDQVELAMIRRLLDRTSGLILVSGPVSSGKSSTLYAALRYLSDGSRKIHTLEDPIEHAIPGVIQTGINLRAGLDFADLLAAVLRHSPDVIMIGEVRDERTAATAVRAGASGQLVLATIHAKTAAEAIDVMRQYGANPHFLAAALTGVINQRLIRRLDDASREPIETDEELPMDAATAARLAGAHPVLYRVRQAAEGDHRSPGSSEGFTSLTCLPEIMIIDHDLDDAIAHEVPAPELHSRAIDRGMMTLAQAARLRVYRGETTPQEAFRVVNDPVLASLVALERF